MRVIPWEKIDQAKVPGHDGEVTLLKRGAEFSIRTAGTELMNSRCHGSEDAMAELTCCRLKKKSGRRILIGGPWYGLHPVRSTGTIRAGYPYHCIRTGSGGGQMEPDLFGTPRRQAACMIPVYRLRKKM